MEENNKKEPENPEEEGLLDKADDFIEEKIKQIKESKPFESVAGAFDKAADKLGLFLLFFLFGFSENLFSCCLNK